MWLVAGLGNPGKEYAGTRHNAGFLFVEAMAAAWGVRLGGRRHRAKTAEARRGDETVILAEPQTFMNLSGHAVRALSRARGIPPDRVLVVYDDLDLPLGEVRLRKQGGAGTHNGMRSVVQELGTTAFPRLRLGIGPLPPNADATDYVLCPFRPHERETLDRSLSRAGEALEVLLDAGIEKAMTEVNTAPPEPA